MPNDQMPRGGLLVSQDAPPYLEATRLGYGWSTMTTTATAPQAAFPTVTADLELWNNVNSGMTMVIDRLSVWEKLGTAITRTTAIFAMVAATKAVPTLTALVIGSMSGRGLRTSAVGAPVVTGVQTTVIANDWQPYGSVQAWGTSAATPGGGWHAEVSGKLIVPPGRSLCIAIIGPTATGTIQCGASWYEVPNITNVG